MPCGACHGLLCRVTVRREHALWSGIRVKASRVFSEGLAKGRARCHSGCGLLWGLGPSSKHAHIDRYTQTHTGTQQHTQTHRKMGRFKLLLIKEGKGYRDKGETVKWHFGAESWFPIKGYT